MWRQDEEDELTPEADYIAAMHSEGIWVTKEGQKIPVKDLTTSHLKNITKMLVRNARQEHDENVLLWLSTQSFLQGDGALESVGDEPESADWYQVLWQHPIWQALYDELAKRDLMLWFDSL